jgi:hypothetical protein
MYAGPAGPPMAAATWGGVHHEPYRPGAADDELLARA